MGVKIQWIDPNIDPLDTVEIWRSATKAGAPVKIGEVPGSVHEFQDDTVARNKVAWYTLKSVLGSSSAMGKPFAVGNFPDTGPGPANIMRGTWEFGVFGEVSPNELPGYSEINTALGVAPDGTPTKFTKWIVNGRILYVPNVRYKAAFGNIASFKDTLIDLNGTEDSKLVIDREGRGYVVRPPLATNNAFTGPTTLPNGGDETLQLTEVAAVIASIVGADTALTFNQYKWGDNALVATANWHLTNTYTTGNAPMGFTTAASCSLEALTNATITRAFWPVYELLTT